MKTHSRRPPAGRFISVFISFAQCGLAFVFVLLFAAAADGQGKTVAEQMINRTPVKQVSTGQAKKPAKRFVAKTAATANPPKRTQRESPKVAVTPKEDLELSPANRYRITVLTGVPGVELWEHDRQLGISDASLQVFAYLSSGEHQIKVKKDGQDLNIELPVTVSVEQTQFDFTDKINQAVSLLPKDPQENKVEEESVDIGAVLEAYKNPELTKNVTLKDWQAIHKQGMQQMLDGDTEDKIEAISSFAQGQIELANGNRLKAVSAFSAAIIFEPNSTLAHYGLGNAYLASGQLAEAATAYQKSIQLDVKFALPHKQLGDVLLAQGKNKEAAASYQQAKSLGLKSDELRLSLATTQIRTKNCPAAVKELEDLLKDLDNSDSQSKNLQKSVFIALGECYAELKRPLAAIEAFNKAIENNPESPVAYFKVGEIYVDQREYEKAKEALEKALSLDVEGKQVNLKEVQDLIEKSRRRIR